MKKIAALLALLLCLLVGYCALPLTSVSVITIALEDGSGQQVTENAKATFRDADGKAIVEIALNAPPSWSNNIHWWAHSSNPESVLRPADARRATSAVIEAQGCAPLTLPIELRRQYVPPSLSPHGGGKAYMLYEFRDVVRLQCDGG